MTRSPKSNDGPTVLPRTPAILLLVTIADTTWRMFAPTLGGTFVGIGLDHLFNSAPIWTIVMIVIGFVTSLLLIYLQIKNLRKK